MKETSLGRLEGKNRHDLTLFFRGKECLEQTWLLAPITVIAAFIACCCDLACRASQGVPQKSNAHLGRRDLALVKELLSLLQAGVVDSRPC